MKRTKPRTDSPNVAPEYSPPVAGWKARPCLGLGCSVLVEGTAGTRLCGKCRARRADLSKLEQTSIKAPARK